MAGRGSGSPSRRGRRVLLAAAIGAALPAIRPPRVPTGKDQCKHGGWRRFGFKNQGQCIAFVHHGP
jgi:hypothetical protein